MCDQCGFIDNGNRKTQEAFECLECGNQLNADYNASLNIKNRFVSNVLKHKLHNFDEFQRLIPKKLKKELIKEILEDYGTGLNCTFNQINC